MARRDDGNEPVVARPRRTGGSAWAEEQELGQSPASQEQVDLVPPVVVDSSLPPEAGNPSIPDPLPGAANPLDFSSLPDLCLYGVRPQYLNGIFVRTLQAHFSDPLAIQAPDLRKSCQWSPDKAVSRLAILASTQVDSPTSGKLPRLIVKRGPQQTTRAVLDDRAEDIDGTGNLGTTRYIRFSQGSTTINCLGESDLQTEMLGNEVFGFLTQLSPYMRRVLPFHDFQVASLGEVQPLNEVGGKFLVGLQVNYIYEYAWLSTEMAPTLNGLSFEVTATT